jgi:aminoglycoside 2'-N-acetyltransferase I
MPTTARTVTELRTAHTADLDADTKSTIRQLMDAVFDRFTDDSWENALGGMHTLLYDGAELIGHASVIQRRLLHGGRALRAGYVEAVAVRADRRRQGHGDTMMAEIERIIRGGYDLGALGASPEGKHLYAARGWQLWQGPSSAMTPDGIRPTADKDGFIYVLPVSAPLDLTGDLISDWRHGPLW